MSFALPSLPYPDSALEPYISARALRIHHDELQQKYVTRLNVLLRGTPFDQLPLEQLIVDPPEQEIFDNAAQVWNHTFLWHSMMPKGGKTPARSSGFARALTAYGSHESFKRLFRETAKDVFGSGWVWLAADATGNVVVWVGKDADNPMRYGHRPLLVLDMWEHAYFLNYEADRNAYVDAFLDHLVNWRFAEANYERAFGA